MYFHSTFYGCIIFNCIDYLQIYPNIGNSECLQFYYFSQYFNESPSS